MIPTKYKANNQTSPIASSRVLKSLALSLEVLSKLHNRLNSRQGDGYGVRRDKTVERILFKTFPVANSLKSFYSNSNLNKPFMKVIDTIVHDDVVLPAQLIKNGIKQRIIDSFPA